jgi:hypothetical protein
MTAPENPGTDAVPIADVFVDDEVQGELAAVRYDAATMTTVLTTKQPLPSGVDFTRRPVTFADNLAKKNGGGGQWRVIAQASGNQIVVWGRIDPVTKVPKFFKVLRTFTLKADAPAGIGASLK